MEQNSVYSKKNKVYFHSPSGIKQVVYAAEKRGTFFLRVVENGKSELLEVNREVFREAEKFLRLAKDVTCPECGNYALLQVQEVCNSCDANLTEY